MLISCIENNVIQYLAVKIGQLWFLVWQKSEKKTNMSHGVMT